MIAVIEAIVFEIMPVLCFVDLAGVVVHLTCQCQKRWPPSCRKQAGFGVRFVVRENDVEIRDRQVLVGLRASQPRDQIAYDVETRAPLVIGMNDDPGSKRARRSREHHIPSLSIRVPLLYCDLVDGARLPLCQRIIPSVSEALLLLLFADVQVVLHNLNSGTDQHVFQWQHFFQETLIFTGRAETHHSFDARPVVPTAIEQDQLLRRRQIRDIALKVPGGAILVGRLPERHDPRLAWAEMLDDMWTLNLDELDLKFPEAMLCSRHVHLALAISRCPSTLTLTLWFLHATRRQTDQAVNSFHDAPVR